MADLRFYLARLLPEQIIERGPESPHTINNYLKRSCLVEASPSRNVNYTWVSGADSMTIIYCLAEEGYPYVL